MGQGMNDTTPRVGSEHHFYHGIDETSSLSTAIVSALAEIEETDPTALGFTLHDYVDPDALDAIFAPKLDGTMREECRLEFSLPDHHVTVFSDGHIIVKERNPPR